MTVPENALLCGRYRLQDSIGRGGMADVYLAFDETRQAHVAVKILREDMAEDPDFVRRFRREGEALARLDHPNIVRFYAFEQDGPTAFIVMDYIEGTTLRRYLHDRRGPLPLDEITRLLRDVCAALHYAHLNGFVHRDLKPGNIMLKPNGRALLTDFGISRALEGATLTGAAMGTPAYMSPEQITGAQVDPRSDIYSLGVMLFEMTTGRRPFTGEEPGLTTTGTTTRLQQAHLRLPAPDPRTLNPVLPPDAAKVILRALAKQPADRWPDVVTLRQAWEAATGVAHEMPGTHGVSTAAARTPTTPTGGALVSTPRATRRTLPWTLALIGVLLIVTVVGAMTLTRKPTVSRSVAPIVTASTAVEATIATTPTARGEDPTFAPDASPGQAGGGVRMATRVPSKATPTPAAQPATPTLLPTATLAPSPSSPTLTLAPTRPEPSPPSAQSLTVNVSLKGEANASTTDGYIGPPTGNVALAGILFSLEAGGSVTTQAAPLPDYPARVSLQVDVQNPEAVHLLLTGGDLYDRFVGKVVGEIALRFSDGTTHVVSLIAGENLREWKQGGGVISRSSSPSATEVWRGSNRFDASQAVIDMLSIRVPAPLQASRLVSIDVTDLSTVTVGELDPALNLLGLSIVQRPPPTTVPTDSPTSTPMPTAMPTIAACSVPAADSLQEIWRQNQQLLGCALNRLAQSDAAAERFEHGRMIWRKSNDMIYVLYDDGDWAAYPDRSVDGEPEPAGFEAPAGLHTPVRGFGVTWRAALGGTGARIGWATEAEYGLPIQVQDFQHGLVFMMSDTTYLLGDDGRTWRVQ